MYLVAIAWLYVALMMSLAEAFHPQGGWLGALFTFLLYGLLPISVVLYVMGTPLRRRQRAQEEARSQEAGAQAAPSPAASPASASRVAGSPEA